MHRMTSLLACLLLLTISLGVPLAWGVDPRLSVAGIYDLANDWSDMTNPNGVWSYNQSPGIPITSHQSDWDPPRDVFTDSQPAWANASYPSLGHVPMWAKVVSESQPGFDFAIGRVVMHGSERGNEVFPGVTWTSPIDGQVEISGGVWLARKTLGRKMDWNILHNRVVITSGSLTSTDLFTSDNPFDLADGSGGASALVLPVSVGDIITLELFNTSGYAEFVGVDLTITILGYIDGLVTDVDTAEPIERALVLAIQLPSKDKFFSPFTDEDGYYDISDLAPGLYLVIAIKKGYNPGVKIAQVVAGEGTWVEFWLTPKLE